MKYLQDIPTEAIWVVVIVAIIFAVIAICVRNAQERDEDAVLFSHLNGIDRELKKPELEDLTSADQEVKK